MKWKFIVTIPQFSSTPNTKFEPFYTHHIKLISSSIGFFLKFERLSEDQRKMAPVYIRGRLF